VRDCGGPCSHGPHCHGPEDGRSPLVVALVVIIVVAMSPHLSSWSGASPAGASSALAPVAVMSFELHLDPAVLEARPTSSQNGPVVFNGSAEVPHVPPGLRVTVTLSSSCDWPSIVSPSTMVFSDANPQAFYVSVVVPPGTARGERAQLRVSGTAKAPLLPEMTDTAFANVTVAPYYGVRIEDAFTDGKAERGSTVVVTLNITNMCNFDLACHLELLDPPQGLSAGPTDTTTIAMFTYALVTIAIYVSDEAATGSSDVMVGVVYPEQARGAPECHATTKVVVVDARAQALSWGVTSALLIALIGGIALIIILRRKKSRRKADGRKEAL